MKKNLLAVAAVVLAIAASSFTVKKSVAVYFDYTTTNVDHSDRQAYTETQSALSPVFGSSTLAWIKIEDNDGDVSDIEFNQMFDALDRSVPANTTLNDDAEGIVSSIYQLEKK